MFNRFLRRFLLATMFTTTLIMSAAAVGTSPEAHAGELAARKVFTRIDTYYELTDRNGTFSAQVAWASAQNTVYWSFRPSPAVRAIATGPMDCTAGHLELPGYHDQHLGLPVDYRWHSTVQGSFFNVDYTLWGTCSFPVQANGQAGQAVLNFHFNYYLESVE